MQRKNIVLICTITIINPIEKCSRSLQKEKSYFFLHIFKYEITNKYNFVQINIKI